ncbi:MAG: ferredoxin [Clostridia bacterium]|nr:ferredoxin [Clostridia bacterium]
MIYNSKAMEEQAVLNAAAKICAAARTAPKGKGIDYLETMVLTGAEKDALADTMERMGNEYGMGFFLRDAGNIRAAGAVVLFGMRENKRELHDICGYCHFKNCADCAANNGVCAFDAVDIGIAIGSAVSVAADERVDTRVLFSAGRAALEEKLLGDGVTMVFAVPISVSGKSPFFDRKPK